MTISEPSVAEFRNEDFISMTALENPGWEFSHWSITNNSITTEKTSAITKLKIENQGEVVAHFKELFYVYVPNAFSPNNGDLKHNTFDISIYSGIDFEFSLEIYNRFGEPIFSSQDPNDSWDGTYKNQDVPNGVYTYILNVKPINSTNAVFKRGNITLLR